MDIELRGVSDRPLLASVNLRIGSGVTWLSGKDHRAQSALLRIVALRSPPRGGAVLVSGRAVGSMAAPERGELRRRIGFAPSGADLPDVQVRHAMLYIAALWRVRGHRRPDSELERWGLSDLKARRLGSLSPGQRRRFVLAASRVMDPDLWVLERPFEGLDAPVSALIDMLVADAYLGRGPVRTVVIADDSPHGNRLPYNRHFVVEDGTVALL